MDQTQVNYDLIIIGAGPAGLAVANSAQERGLSALVIERGAVANAVARFPVNMRFFSTSNLIELGDVPLISQDEKPNRTEALNYYRRFVEVKRLNVELYRNVTEVMRNPDGTFTVDTLGRADDRKTWTARHVVLATGAYDNPCRLGVPGEDLPHVSHYYVEPHPYFRQKVLIVGGRHSAAEAALEIWRHGGHVTLSYRGHALNGLKYWVQPDIENRIREGSIRAIFNSTVTAIGQREVLLEQDGQELAVPADFVLLMTGYEPDTQLLDRIGITYNPETRAPAMNVDTFESRDVPGLYLAGVICAGNISGAIFIENSRNHGERIVEHILSQ